MPGVCALPRCFNTLADGLPSLKGWRNSAQATRSPAAMPLRAWGGINNQRDRLGKSGTTKVALPFCTIRPTNSVRPDSTSRSISATVRPALSCFPCPFLAGRIQIAILSPGRTLSISSGGINISRPSAVTAKPYRCCVPLTVASVCSFWASSSSRSPLSCAIALRLNIAVIGSYSVILASAPGS